MYSVLTSNISGKVRSESFNGRDYLVAPLTLIVPGVLNGSSGPLLYNTDEISRNPEMWNQVPLVVYHPSVGGVHVSARDPNILKKQGIGSVYRAKVVNGKLVAEGWFDIELVEKVDPSILKRLQNGNVIELSTGLYVDKIPASNYHTTTGSSSGSYLSYSHVAVNFRPDHVAILPDQVGACSVRDGCGVLVNTANGVQQFDPDSITWQEIIVSNIGSDEQRRLVDMTLTNEQRVAIISELTTNCECWKGEAAILGNFSDDKLNLIKTKFDRDQQVLAVANAAVRGYTDGNGNAYRVNPETGKWETGVVSKPVTSTQQTQGVTNTTTQGNTGTTGQGQGGTTTQTDSYRAKKPQTMEEWLSEAPAEVQATFNSAREIEKREKETIIGQLLTNVSESEKRIHFDRLMKRSVDDLRYDLEMLPKNKKSGNSHNNGTVDSRTSVLFNQQVDEDILTIPDVNWNGTTNHGGSNGQATTNREGNGVTNNGYNHDSSPSQFDSEWLKAAPAHIRQTVNTALQLEAKERRRLIEELTSNISNNEEEQRLISRLQNKSLEELTDMIALIPKKSSGNKVNYFGAIGGTTNNSYSGRVSTEDILPLPVMDWKKTE